MSRITAPLLSFGASGAIAKTQVYSRWKGIPYVRQYVIPANPNSDKQKLTRSVFSWLQLVWKFAPSHVTAAFAAYAMGQPMTDRNAWVKNNLKTLRDGTDLTGIILSPGAKSGLAAVAVAAANGVGSSVVTITAPALPSGWTITKAVAAGILQQDPHTDLDYTIVSGEDLTSTYEITLSALAAGTWVVGGWFVFEKPDGSVAYGPSILDLATIT